MSVPVRSEADRGAAWLFWALLSAFTVIYLAFYPRTYAIYDESCTLSLAYSLAHGTVFVDHAGPLLGFQRGSHLVSYFSPFHAALLLPVLALNWHLAFFVTGAFFVLGAFIIRGMLLREGLGAGWCFLYFSLASALFYSQTLMAAVPAAVMGLLGVSMLMRPDPRPIAGAMAFGVGVLLHPWTAPIAIIFSAVWLLESGWKSLRRYAAAIAVGAAPAVIALGIYNYVAIGNPFVDPYTFTDHWHKFTGPHLLQFSIFYLGSLALFPLAGLAVLSPRLSRGWALPITAAVMLSFASLYTYRDGLNVGSARVANTLALAAGLIPGQRFLIPVSMLACLPAARFLDARLAAVAGGWNNPLAAGVLAVFAAGFITLSAAHQAYLDAHAKVQDALARALPAGAEMVIGSEVTGDDPVKELALIGKIDDRVKMARIDSPAPGAYISYLTLPGNRPPENWITGRRLELISVRSWAWNRDLWIGDPADASANSAAH